MKRAFITGLAGQDGSYLAELLLAKGYEVFGCTRSGHLPAPLKSTLAAARLVPLVTHDPESVAAMVRDVQPDEIYHLAAHHQSSANTGANFDSPIPYVQTNLLSAANLLTAVATHRPACRIFFASSCHVFGETKESPQNENTPLNPTNQYGITKAAALRLGRFFRETKGLYVSTGILYNHESPRRKESFLPARIAATAVRIKQGRETTLTVGNLAAQVDWGCAIDYVKAMWLSLQPEHGSEYVIATGELHTPEEFIREAFGRLGLDFDRHVKSDPGVYRPVSSAVFRGDASRIAKLGWRPETSFKELVRLMVEHHLQGVPPA